MSNSKMSKTSKDNRQNSVEYRYNLDGSENPKYVDLLDEDKAIAAQNSVAFHSYPPNISLNNVNIF